MAAGGYILAADLGTSGLKLALCTATGEIVGSEVEPYGLTILPNGGVEQDPQDWWTALVHATRRLMARTGLPPADVVAFNASVQWSGTVAVDRHGRPLMNAIIWMDSRGADQARRITGGLVKIEGYGARRLLTWIRRTGGAPGHSGKDPIAHILFIRDAHPDVYRATHRFLEPKDWLNLRLTGRFVSSFDAITLHWVTDTRDIANVRYDGRLLRMAGLERDRDKLPELVPAASVLGPMTADAAAELGLTERVQIVSGAADIMAAAIGSGAVRDFEAHVCLGTSSWLLCHVPCKKTDLFHNMASLPSAIPGRYLLSNEQESAGLCLATLVDHILFPDGAPPDAYERVFAMAAGVPAGSDRLIFAPWLNGERSPVDDRLARGGFFNQSLETTRSHLVRAVLEGVAFNSRWLLRYVERFIKRPLPAITIIGGGARSDLWCQIYADVLDRPIRRVAEPRLAGARGAAFQAAAALGFITFDEIADRVPIERTFEPHGANRATYDALFAEFVNLYKSNRKIYARLNRST